MSTEVRKPISTVAIQVINKLEEAITKSPTGVSFVRINGYTNSKGEVSNVTINIGVNYTNVKDKDLNYLETVNVTEIETDNDDVKALLNEAKTVLIEAQKKPSTNRSKGQADAYTRLKGAPQLKVHNETGQIYLEGYQVNKKILVEGEYKEINSRPLTLAKDLIRKGMRASKIRQYKLNEINSIAISGDTIEFIDQTI